MPQSVESVYCSSSKLDDAWAGTEISFFNTSLDRESLLVAKTGFISSDMYSLVNNHTLDDDVFDTAQAPASAILSGWQEEGPIRSFQMSHDPPPPWECSLYGARQLSGNHLEAECLYSELLY